MSRSKNMAFKRRKISTELLAQEEGGATPHHTQQYGHDEEHKAGKCIT
jgi:hypothetical protein